MKTFQEFYEDKKAEAAFQEVLVEFVPMPGVPSALKFAGPGAVENAKEIFAMLKDPTGFFFDKIKEFLGAILGSVAATLSVFLGARILGKAINYITKKNKERLEEFNDEVDFDKKFEKEIRLAEIAEKGEYLSDSEILRLKKSLADDLAEKYPSKKPSWWLELLDKTGSFLDSKTGAGMAVLAFIMI